MNTLLIGPTGVDFVALARLLFDRTLLELGHAAGTLGCEKLVWHAIRISGNVFRFMQCIRLKANRR